MLRIDRWNPERDGLMTEENIRKKHEVIPTEIVVTNRGLPYSAQVARGSSMPNMLVRARSRSTEHVSTRSCDPARSAARDHENAEVARRITIA